MNFKHQTPTLNGQIVGNKEIACRNFKDYMGYDVKKDKIQLPLLSSAIYKTIVYLKSGKLNYVNSNYDMR